MRSKSLIRFAITAACLPAFGTLAYSGESVRYDLQIERQSLSSALQEFAKQSGVQVSSGASLGSPITFVPSGYAGPASDNGAGLVANAGQYNFDLADTAGSGRQGLVNAPTVKSFLGSVRREFTSWLDGYLELATCCCAPATEPDFCRRT